MKYVPYIIFGIAAALYVRHTIRKALSEPPDEQRVYESPEAAYIDGAADDGEWFLEPPEGY